MRPSLTVPPVPHRCLSRAASSRTPSSSKGRSNTVVTPLPRRPAVSLPTFNGIAFLAGSFTGGDTLAVASVGWLSRRWPFAENASHEAHDLLLDQVQHLLGVVNVPEFDLLSP